jgi:hypothetical protein
MADGLQDALVVRDERKSGAQPPLKGFKEFRGKSRHKKNKLLFRLKKVQIKEREKEREKETPPCVTRLPRLTQITRS